MKIALLAWPLLSLCVFHRSLRTGAKPVPDDGAGREVHDAQRCRRSRHLN